MAVIGLNWFGLTVAAGSDGLYGRSQRILLLSQQSPSVGLQNRKGGLRCQGDSILGVVAYLASTIRLVYWTNSMIGRSIRNRLYVTTVLQAVLGGLLHRLYMGLPLMGLEVETALSSRNRKKIKSHCPRCDIDFRSLPSAPL